jgi:hypothetical protein
VPTMTDYDTLLMAAAGRVTSDTDPDGAEAQLVLLLAAHAGVAPDAAMSADWDLYAVAITEAVRRLQEDLAEQVVLAAGLPLPEPDSSRSRQQVTAVVRRLANLYATAAASETGSAWRRLTWAQVAHLLDDAAKELT